MKLLFRPYNVLLIAAVVLLIWFWLLAKPLAIDVHLHDTYVVIEPKYLVLVAALYLMLLASLYLSFQKKLLSTALTWLHTGISIAAIAICCLLIQSPEWFTGAAGIPRRFQDLNGWESIRQHNSGLSRLVTVLAVVFITAQVLLPVNIIGGWRQRRG